MAYKTITLNEAQQDKLTLIAVELNNIALNKGGDNVCLHGTADSLLCEALEILGYAEISNAWQKADIAVDFWYS